MSYQPAEHRPCKVTEWTPAPAFVAYTAARYPKVNHVRAYERFVAHHRGRATKSSSWDAMFLNWLDEDAAKIGEHAEGGTDYRGVPNDSIEDWNHFLMGKSQPPPEEPT